MVQSLTARQMAAAEEEGDNARAETDSPSSSEPDFYADTSADAHPDPAQLDVQQEKAEQQQQQRQNSAPSLPDPLGPSGEPVEEDDTQDSSSDMDVSESSRSSSPESDQEQSQEQEQPQDQHQLQAQSQIHAQDLNHVTTKLTGTKRKLSDAAEDDNLDALEQALHEDPSKKRRHSPSQSSPVPPNTDNSALVASLPPELWQHIFLRLSPAMLSRCLRVCRAFNTYLTKTKAQPTLSTAKKPKDPEKDKVKTVDSDSIWAEARKLYFPNMPRPLMRCSELTMIQLIGGKTCQFCGKTPAPLPATGPFSAGPGPHGLRVVWPFGIRTCGQCFDQHTLKDVELLVSPAASLRFGLPYAFRTPDLHFVPEMTRQLPGGIPSHLRVAKVHYQADVQTIQEEYEDVKGYGEGTAEEWRKGLVTKGKEAMADAARWEKWESQIRLGADLPHALREYDLASFPKYVEETQGKSAAPNDDVSGAPLRSLATTKGGLASLPQPVHAFQNGYGAPLQPAHSSHFPPPLPHMPRPLRKTHEVDEDRAARKADIERRCMELQPPLEPKVLQHIEPFQAAMQITTPMDDAQWEVLRPRILAEREAAELVEHQKATQLAALQAAIPTAGDNDVLASMRPAKEVYDKEYENIQDPLRKRLAEYADGLIQSSWNGGEGLNRDSVTSLAIQIVLHVRKRYLEDKRAGQLPDFSLGSKDASKGSKYGTPQPHPVPFLSLDNMKWVHDNKIRPYTDPHRKELFICAGCAADNSAVGKPKWFAFEGLIQHYGAKHTSAFSKGNIVVHWQTAEWPDEPPFLTNVAPYLKMERKAAEFRASHNHRKHGGHTIKQDRDRHPEAGRGGYGTGETNLGMMLSENPLFSAGVHAQTGPSGNGYPPYQGHHGTAQSVQSTQQAPQHVPAHMSYDAQLTQLAADARDVWDVLDGVNDLMEPVKMQTVIHHVVIRFQQRFYQRPSLDLLTDALATNPDMKPLKNTNGLACKFCVATQTDGSANYQSYYARIRNVKLYNTSSLITHFKIIHPQPAHSAAPGMDWTESMIELPEAQLISDLIRAPGMDDEKISLIASAFPNAFPYPLPKIGMVQDALPTAKEEVGADSGLATRLLGRLNRKAPQQGKKKKGGGHHQQQQWQSNGIETSTREGSQETSDVAVGEDEYDPRRPSGTGAPGLDPNDPARFDTDLAKMRNGDTPSLSQHPPAASHSSGTWNLAPETLAALNNLTALQQSQQQPSSSASSHGPGPSEAAGGGFYAREERSPSVGRAEPASTTTGTAGTPTSGQRAQAPDISAILASLTGQAAQHHQQQQQVATSPVAEQPQQYTLRPPTATAGKPLYEYGTPERGRRATSGRYASSGGGYGGSAEGQQHQHDLNDALARNQRDYEQNSQVPFSQQAQPQQIPRPSSPPRYRYEDEYPPPHSTVASVPSSQYLPAAQQPPSMSAAGPVQYIHLPQDPYAGVRSSHTPTTGYSQQALPQPQQQQTSYQPVYESSYYPPYQQHHEPPSPSGPQLYHPPPAAGALQPARPIYIDEHGRQLELIPIDDHDENPAVAPGPPPAPVQYAPHPFEQQQEQYAGGHGHGHGYAGYGAYHQPPPQSQQQNQQEGGYGHGYQSSYPPQPPQSHGQGDQYYFPPAPLPPQQQHGGQGQAQYAYHPYQPYEGPHPAQPQQQQGLQQQGVQPFPDSNLRPPSPFA
ncbi:hypothetical protein KC340_g5643 [Hortaea werneckii]|nr:hypothetical protein KC342_g5911 [Hortaea werneckii]KAI7099874.1 hypothetical protein KC339_g7893 [Hortaea werneckii]KAI7242347.1 hypothetical protein KC365_g3262 [Hortaea werneckii]KAI7327260.1 hypothetical protein KC340_g5643 [Hortaea werneckii]KAI7403729.1 hypothetical protein KC328_g2202 [Hortaea werneckii]